jgi:hypothetical protein
MGQRQRRARCPPPPLAVATSLTVIILASCSVRQCGGLLVVGSQAVVFSETDFRDALLRPDVDVISIAHDLDLSPSMWPPAGIQLGRRVTVQSWLMAPSVAINASAASRGAVGCTTEACHIELLGPGMVWFNAAVPGDPVLDFLTPFPTFFGPVRTPTTRSTGML